MMALCVCDLFLYPFHSDFSTVLCGGGNLFVSKNGLPDSLYAIVSCSIYLFGLVSIFLHKVFIYRSFWFWVYLPMRFKDECVLGVMCIDIAMNYRCGQYGLYFFHESVSMFVCLSIPFRGCLASICCFTKWSLFFCVCIPWEVGC